MSYQVLARKWRPQTFKEVIGQPHVLTALENGLTQNRVHHAYLFSGTRGVGKTTIARLLAKSLNCEQGVTATPCGQCANCQAIDQGRFVDLLEIDAASRTKVDDTRELLDNVQYKPAQGRYKVYLIDEVHMLSKHSFNALLKTLEEPPEYVKFLLATTDPQKLPITVLSRCLQFHLKAILPEQIEQQLISILKQEQATFELPALNVIAKAADGSMRDALSLTDQALAFGAGHIEYAAVLKMLGTIDQSHLHYLLHFIASGNSQKVFEKIQEFVHLGADFSALHQALASLCHQIALAQLQHTANVSKKTAVQLLAERLTPEEVQLFYQIALQGYKDYNYAPNGKVALEMTVMRLLAFKPANYIDIDEAILAESAAPVIESNVHIQSESVVEQNTKITTLGTSFTSPSSVVETSQFTPPSDNIETTSVMIDNNAASTNVEADIHHHAASTNVETDTHHHASTADVAPLLTTSHSRNMLRSHRLKREALKKTEAATDTSLSESKQLVASDINNVASEDVPDKENNLGTHNQTPLLHEEHRKQTADIEPQNLPPISSYQNQLDQPEVERWPSQEAPDFTSVDVSSSLSLPTNQIQTEQDLETSKPTEAFLDKKKNDDISHLNQHVSVAEEVSFVLNENSVATEIDIASYVDDKVTDPWFLTIKSMQLVGLEKLLAKNCILQMQQQQHQIVLKLNEYQQHLLNNHGLCDSLKEKLRQYYGEQYTVDIKVGHEEGQHTPQALEMIVYQQYLAAAKTAIKNDPIVQSFVQDYAAKVYENSIVPL